MSISLEIIPCAGDWQWLRKWNMGEEEKEEKEKQKEKGKEEKEKEGKGDLLTEIKSNDKKWWNGCFFIASQPKEQL